MIGKSQIWVVTQPSAQSPFHKINLTISVKKHANVDIKLFLSFMVSLHFSILFQIFCPGLQLPQIRIRWEVLGDQWRGMPSGKSHKYCTVSGRVPKVSKLTVFRKVGKLKTQILGQPVNNKGCSSIQFLLREFYQEHKKCLLRG